jgi:hypothetical protein
MHWNERGIGWGKLNSTPDIQITTLGKIERNKDHERLMDPSIANKNQQSIGFLGHAIQRKHNFIHLLLMGGVLLLTMKSVG